MKPVSLVLIVASVLAAGAAQNAVADEGPFEIRLRAIYLDPANNSDAIPALAVPQNAIHIN
jgi:outer membrane protein